MQWKDDYLVNVREVDTQHKKLVSLVVELDTAMRQGKGRDVVGKILTSLVQYTQYHFGTEDSGKVRPHGDVVTEWDGVHCWRRVLQ